MTEIPGHEWDSAALDVARDYNRSIGSARDLVILDWLSKGDTRPLSDWVMRGHVPDDAVMKALAVMLVRGHPDADRRWLDDPAVSETAEIFTLGLRVTGKGKRKADPAICERDKRIALEVAKAKQSMSELKAFAHVAQWLSEIGFRNIGAHSVEKIYKENKHLIYRTNSR